MKKNNDIKVLILDVETSPILSSVWNIWQQDIGLNQIERDWSIIAWCGKWLGEDKVFYRDQRDAENIENDKEILKELWQLLDSADVIVTQNGKRFDIPKINARFIINGMLPPSSYKQIDTKEIAARKFGFTSNKLEYLTKLLCKKNKKTSHPKFPGFSLWKECLKGNKQAWDEMKKYNIADVKSTEELFEKLAPWAENLIPNFNLYHDSPEIICHCGSKEFKLNGFKYTASGKFQRFKCSKCGAETRGKENLFSKEKRKSLRMK